MRLRADVANLWRACQMYGRISSPYDTIPDNQINSLKTMSSLQEKLSPTCTLNNSDSSKVKKKSPIKLETIEKIQ